MQTVFITGCSSGFGLEIARDFLERGWNVVATMRTPRADLLPASDRLKVLALDVTDADSIRQAVDAAGPIDVLVNNAGVALTKPFLDLTDADWSSILDVNLDGAFRVAQAVARRMRDAKRGGSIVNVASLLGLRVAAQVAPYAASKAALIQLTKAMALELARFGIRVNAIAPGYVETAINRDFFATEAGQALVKRIPQRRLGRVEDLDAPLLLLASDTSAYMTGAVVVVDGGHSINSI